MHPAVQVPKTSIHRPRPFRDHHHLITNLLQEHTGMLQLLLEINEAMGNSHPFCHYRDRLHSLLFQDRNCGAPLGYVSATHQNLTLFFTPVHFLGQLLYINNHGTRRCCPNRPGPLPPATSCPVTGFRPTASFRFIMPRRVPFSGSKRVRICWPRLGIHTYFRG